MTLYTRAAMLLVLCYSGAALAAVPQSMHYQGYLTDPSGVAIEGSLSVTFAVYSVETGGTAIWSETRTVDVQTGLFSVDLGAVAAFPVGLFDTPLWVGISVGGDPEMTPRRALTSAAFSFKADDALSLQGQGPAELDQSGDVANLDSRLSAVELNDELTFLTYDGGLDGIDVDGRLRVVTERSGGLTIEEAPGAGSGNPTEVFFNQAEVAGAGEFGVIGFDTGRGVFMNAAGGVDELSITGDGEARLNARLNVFSNRSGSVSITETSGASGNPTEIFFNQSEVAGAGQFGVVGYDAGIVFLDSGGGTDELKVRSDGRVEIPYRLGIGTSSPQMALDVNGDAAMDVLTIRGGADIVEGFDTNSGDLVEPGSVMVIDAEHPGKLRTSDTAYDSKVAGVVSGAGGVQPGIKLGQDGILDGDLPMAMSGRVYVKCSTQNGPIRPGDRLTTSSLSGHAMRATDRDRADGAVIGKAMSSLEHGTGLVLVLVNLQ